MEKLKEEIRRISDPRRLWGNLRHKLEDIVIIGLCSILCGGEDFDDMEEFGRERKEWLSGFLELPNGIPDGDTFRRVFERLNSVELSMCLGKWLESNRGRKGGVVNIDGKTIRGSANAEHTAFHVVSAWAAENGITLGELAVQEKSNEIKAIPELLDLIDVQGTTVTIDAMGCQKDIAQKIIDKGANYVLALKGNQGSLHDETKLHFEHMDGFLHTETLEKDHGRIEHREYFLETEIDWLWQKPNWAGMNAIGMVLSSVNGVQQQPRYYITSLTDVNKFADSVRKHWSIENQLHWMLDVVFHEDASRARKDNSPLNMNVLRKAALSLMKSVNLGRKLSIRKKTFKAALNLSILEAALFQKK
jgi:predicted transposase YbfD/YdcC